MHVENHELEACCNYIQRQMDYQSWWPKEAPGEAREQFDLMKGSALALNEWCKRWLDEGQCKKMERAVRG
jgi:hypothetical protein